MPIKIPNRLPATGILQSENIFVMTETRAMTQDIRPLQILLLNLMPLKIETETQLARVLSNSPLQVQMELIAPSGHVPKNTSLDHMLSFYKTFEEVKTVHYCGLPSDPYHEVARKYLPHGSCGVVSFELKGGKTEVNAFLKALNLAAIETHVADARTCCLNPATTTHRQMTEEQLETAGVPVGLVRISCGLEHKDDLIEDLKQALEATHAH